MDCPRDIVPGTEWVDAIIDGISASRVMVLVLSTNSNASQQIKREVEQVVNGDVIIVPFRIEEVELSKSFKYYLSGTHWMDALTAPIENHIQAMPERINLLLLTMPSAPAQPPAVQEKQEQHEELRQNETALHTEQPETIEGCFYDLAKQKRISKDILLAVLSLCWKSNSYQPLNSSRL